MNGSAHVAPRFVLLPFILLSGWIQAQELVAPSARDAFQDDIRPLVAHYCGNCHAGLDAEAELDLLAFTTPAEVLADPNTWSLVAERLRAHEMPPAKSPQPTQADRELLTVWIEARIGSTRVRDAHGNGAAPGRTVLRRLNRFEIENSILDVLGLRIDATRYLPLDESADGFDTTASALSFSDTHLAGQLQLAEDVGRAAVQWVDPSYVQERVIESSGFATDERFRRGSVLGFFTNGSGSAQLELRQSGEYEISLFARATQAGTEAARMALGVDDVPVTPFDVTHAGVDFGRYTTRLHLEAGMHSFKVAFINDFFAPEHKDPTRRDRNLYVKQLVLKGPLNAKSLGATGLAARAEEDLPRTVGDLAEALWRRPPSADDLTRLLALAVEGEPAPLALRSILVGILASPRFLFRLEREPLGATSRELDGYDLATRLAGFLWSSVPDEQLRNRAARGTLGDSDQLAEQAQRMLRDPRSSRLVEGFAFQWLQLRGLGDVAPDPKRFPDFDSELLAAMKRETELLFEAVLREQRPIADLVDPSFTFLNERLAAHYGIEGLEGELMRRVSLHDRRRGGLLSQASVLTATSYPTRTSPVQRGKWVLEVLLGAAPPPPPPNVPALPTRAAEAGPLSLRASFEEHRANPACAACHANMDPLGFGFENFDAVGAWRSHDRGQPLETQGLLPSGETFSGPVELKALLARDPRLVHNLTERLLVYALGRTLSASDKTVARNISADLDPARNSLSDIIEGIVRSQPFRTLRADADPGADPR